MYHVLRWGWIVHYNNISTILDSIAYAIEEDLYDYFKKKTIFILVSYDFDISTPFLKLDMTVFDFYNY